MKSIYDGVVEASYKKVPGHMPPVMVTAGKREGGAFSPTGSKISETVGKRRKIYLD